MNRENLSYTLDLVQCLANQQVGGKAVNLGRLLQAGFPVPGGFAITTAAYRQSREQASRQESFGPTTEVKAAILAAYAGLGRPTVAVRSSATAEDREDASMAGQYETVLNVQGEEALLQAVETCWASLDSPRTRSYLARHGMRPESVAMGVVVQRQAAADIAGVLFTTNPRAGAMEQALIEASWGLGESVVSGRVQPDTMILDQATGKVLDITVGDKASWLPASGGGEQPTPPEKREVPCLNSRQVLELWRLGRRVATHFRAPQDIEWGFEGDRLFLLQTRAITTIEEIESQELCLSENRRKLRNAAARGQGAWVRHNLGETLPHPTPLTWSVIGHFMSGAGGFGNLYRKAGFEPSQTVCQQGFLELIAGRVYMDLSRSSELFFENFPYAYDLRCLRDNPGASQEPPSVPSGTAAARYRINRRLQEVNANLDALAVDFDQRFDREIAPEFTAWIAAEKKRDLQELTTRQWRELWEERRRRVMDEFAPESLLPTLILARAMQNLRELLSEQFWNEPADSLLQQVAAGGSPDSTVNSAEKLYQATTEHDQDKFAGWLREFGHRAPQEFDLATRRWRERPEDARKMGEHLRGDLSPMQRHRRQSEGAVAKLSELKEQLSPSAAQELQAAVELVHRYQRFREDGKHFLMMGYDLLRDLVLEAQRRLDIDNACLLSFDELHDALTTGFAPLHLLAERERARRAEDKLGLPTLITAGDLDALGESAVADSAAGQYRGLAVSDGRAEGPVRIVLSPDAAENLGRGYVLVCPSTDPNWTPLFSNAAAIVLECGGSLSHGAVVAREMGVPAVVVPDATRLLHESEEVRVDGDHGVVARQGADAEAAEEKMKAETIPCRQIPPPPGRRERSAAALRNRFLLLWAIFFGGLYLLPEAWLYQPAFRLLDRALLPLAAALGWPATVAILAGTFAVLCMAGQRWLTDNHRLREAKIRAGKLQKQARQLAADSERRKAMQKMAGQVQARTLLASFVPLAVLLGPMLLVFIWIPQRAESVWHNPEPGATAYVRALVDGDYVDPVQLRVDPALVIDSMTPAEQSNPPIRATLERLQREWRRSPSAVRQDQPWELRAAGEWARRQTLADLAAYLARPIPPRWLSWNIHTPTEQGGRFPISITTHDGSQSLATHLVLGKRHAPEPREIVDPIRPPVQRVLPRRDDTVLRELEAVYQRRPSLGDDIFWQPLRRLGIDWNAGWLMTYIIAYLPLMFLFRRLLRVP